MRKPIATKKDDYISNLGYLILIKSVPRPSSSDHVFYCPSMRSETSVEGWFMYGRTNPLGMELWDSGGNNWCVNIGYEYRDSYDDDARPNEYQYCYGIGDIASAWTDKGMVSDIKVGEHRYKDE